MLKFKTALQAACSRLRKTDFLGRSLIQGFEDWSTSTKSKKFGNSDSLQKKRAVEAINSVGLQLIHDQFGKRVTAMDIAVDDYGNQVYITNNGLLIQNLKYKTAQL